MKTRKMLAAVLAATMAFSPVLSVGAKSSEAAPDWEDYDALIAEIKTETDTAKREALMHEAEAMLMDTGAIIPLFYYNDTYLEKETVTGTYCNSYGYKYYAFAEKEGDTVLRIATGAGEPYKIDPALLATADGCTVVLNSFEGLATYNSEGKVELALAESYEVSEDGLTYTFTLRDGLLWSDGSKLDANDFVYSWKRAANPTTGGLCSYLYDYAGIAVGEDGLLDVEASEDGREFIVHLSAPSVYLLDLTANPVFCPVQQASVEAAEGWEENPGLWAQEAGFVSNGAFTVAEWVHNESMTLVKNPNYYRADEVKLEKIEFMLSADSTATYAAYCADDLDYLDSIPADEITTLLDSPEFKMADQLGTSYIYFNVNSPLFDGKTPEQAANMRKALSMLIDRSYIVENIGQAGQEAANTFIPTAMQDGNGGIFRTNDEAYTYPNEEPAGYYSLSYDDSDTIVEEAISLLKEAGYEFDENGMLSDETPLTVEYLTGPSDVATAEALQQDFAVIGATLTIQTCDWAVLMGETEAGNFELSVSAWIADFNDPICMLDIWTTDSLNNNAQLGK